jgi:hypothetical protein
MHWDTGAELIYSNGPLATWVAVRNALCTDGERRTVQITNAGDDIYPRGRVRVRGATVTGWVRLDHDDCYFWPDGRLRNAGLLPPADWGLRALGAPSASIRAQVGRRCRKYKRRERR